MISDELKEWRKTSSDQSLGLSHQVIYNKAASLVKKYSKGGSFLDFGAGQGLFVDSMAQENGFDSYRAVDLMGKPETVSEKVQWVQSDLNGPLEIEDQSIDTLTALEIIEHLENPRHVFREMYRVLKKGGHLILSTPNNESYRSMISFMKRGHFVAFTDSSYPAHIVALNRKDIDRIASETGFRVEAYRFSGHGSIPGWTKQSWQKISLGLFNGLRFSDNFFLIATK